MASCPVGRMGSKPEDNPYRIVIAKDRPKASVRDIINLMRPFYWPGSKRDHIHKKVFLRLFLILAILLLMAGKVASLVAPHFLGLTITYLAQEKKDQAIKTLVISGFLYLTGTACDETRNMLYGYIQCNGLTELALNIYQHLHSLDYQWYVESKGGEILRCMMRGLESMRDLTRFGLLLLIPTLIEAIAVCLVFAIYFQMWTLTITVFIGLIVYVLVTIFGTNIRNGIRTAAVQRDNEMNNIANDGLANFEIVKHYNNERYEVERYTKAAHQQQQCQWLVLKSLSVLNTSQEAIKQVTIVVSLLFGLLSVINGDAKVGEVVAIQSYLFYLFRPLFLLGTIYSTICNAAAGIQNVADMMQIKSSVVNKPDAEELVLDMNKDVPMIEYRNVSFSYPATGDKGSSAMLKNINFKIAAGKSMAIVGATGGGKTTVGRLLCRFYDIVGGEILVNGVNIADVTKESLRKSIGVVSQDTVLFHASIRENVSYAKHDATDEEIYEALKQAKLYDRVMELPQKLDTIVGERGMRLSGGEKQRVSIARCLLKNPRIIILDEATSALDSKTEVQIQATLGTMFKNRTVITIAHRLSTIVNCDAIMLIDNGMVKEYGSHEELLRLNGQYKSMWEAQLHTRD
ncbi:ATP-binding cassette sub-family B protein [Babesia gibsoni]|uniref:ATP-binding cassette sub-family B protein n=1 Tax=Babesia gibsoni TaxID=33632 RepID=A0AAD8PER9_BABGI|nr:ATP-binding cassette sub-family B protein [Babesia gibsoni]